MVAWRLVPEDCSDPGALRWAALAAAMGCGLAPALAILKDVRSAVRVENVLAAAPIYWLLLDLITARFGIDIATRRDVVMAFVATGLFSMGVWVAALSRPWRLPKFVDSASSREISAGTAFAMVLVCFGVGIFYYLYKAGFDWQVVWGSLQQSRWGAAWSRTDAKGNWEAFIEHLTYFGMLLPAFVIIIARRCSWWNFKTVVAALLALVYSVFQAQGGNRRYLGVMFGAAIVVWLISSKDYRWRRAIGLLIASSILLGALELTYVYRFRGAAVFYEEEARQELTGFDRIRVDDNFLRLAQSIYYVPAHYPYVWHEYVVFALIRPIPRVFWPEKPLAPSFRIHDQVDVGASLSSSVVGELYVSGGLFAVFLGGWIYGRLGRWGLGLLAAPQTAPRIMLYGSGLMALFAGCRSMQDLVMMSYVVLALLALLVLSKGWLDPVGEAPRRRHLPSRFKESAHKPT